MTRDDFVGKWVRIALHFLVFSALAGIVLRYYNFSVIPGLNYKHLLHAHSHVALLGWMYLAFAAMLVKEFLPADYRIFRKNLLLTLVSVIGMMLSFPFTGYALVSISFSTLFLFASYWFTYRFYQQLQANNDNSIAAGWVRWALFFLVISSIGPWALGPIMVFGESHGVLYNLAIYYYLHFLYNGFFVLAVFGIMMKHLDAAGIDYDALAAKRLFQLTVYAVIPLYGLSVLWIVPPAWVYILSGLAGCMQLVALFFARSVLQQFYRLTGSRFYRVVFGLSLLAYSLKVVMQLLSAVPVIADYVYDTRVFTAIGYLHMVMLGFLSLFALLYLTNTGIFKNTKLSRAGVGIFLSGLIGSVALLFINGVFLTLQGRYIPDYAAWMFISSTLMPAGIILFWLVQLRRSANA